MLTTFFLTATVAITGKMRGAAKSLVPTHSLDGKPRYWLKAYPNTIAAIEAFKFFEYPHSFKVIGHKLV